MEGGGKNHFFLEWWGVKNKILEDDLCFFLMGAS